MDVVYNMTSETKRAEVISTLAAQGYRATASLGSLAQIHVVRVWRVEESDEDAVVASILKVDPGAKPQWPKRAFTHS